MNASLRLELSHIPRGSYHQNLLRAMYNIERRHALASDPLAHADGALRASIADVRREDPLFDPTYDPEFFKLAS